LVDRFDVDSSFEVEEEEATLRGELRRRGRERERELHTMDGFLQRWIFFVVNAHWIGW